MLKFDFTKRFTVNQCLIRDCENGLFRENQFDDIVLAEVTELNMKINIFINFFFSDFDLNDEVKTSTLQLCLFDDLTNISLFSTVHSEEILDNFKDEVILQLTVSFIIDLSALSLNNNILTSSFSIFFLKETCDNSVCMIEVYENNLDCSEDQSG